MKNKLIEALKGVKKRVVLMYLVLPIVINLVIESLSRQNILGGITYMLESPILFIFNTLIIMLTLSVAMFFKRQWFMIATVTVIWLTFGITDFVILQFRRTPFSAVDFLLIKHAIRVSGHYLNLGSIILMAICAIAAIAGLIFLWLKAPKVKVENWKDYMRAAVFVAALSFVIVFMTKNTASVTALATNFSNISEAYENYGFAYCFANSLLDSGIKKPSNYSEEFIGEILDKLKDEPSDIAKRPNIIIVQLESFFDPKYLKTVEFSEDPIPNFTRLKQEYSSGFLTVQSIGAGTANTEFEILTGMNLDHFGACEYPYKTILKRTTSESLCTDLRTLGYTSHAVHNNDATFYGRQRVFSRLGFDSFTPIEYMNNIELNEIGWAKDNILTGEIIKTLDATEGPDFTYGITVQSHGKYNDVEVEEPYKITVTPKPVEEIQNVTAGAVEEEEDNMEAFLDEMHYYVKEINEVDQFIEDLLTEVNKRKEKSIVVFYGDHLPTLSMDDDDVEEMNMYQTEYVIWDNMGLEREERDLRASDLGSHVLEMVDIHEGFVTKMHQQLQDTMEFEEFDSLLEALEYDMLYGNQYCYGGENPYPRINLQMGPVPIKITDVKYEGSTLDVYGNYFTSYSKVYYEGEELETQWISENHLQVQDFTISEEDIEAMKEKLRARDKEEVKRQKENEAREKAAKANEKPKKQKKTEVFPTPTAEPTATAEPTVKPVPPVTMKPENGYEEIVEMEPGFAFEVRQIDDTGKKIGASEPYIWKPEY